MFFNYNAQKQFTIPSVPKLNNFNTLKSVKTAENFKQRKEKEEYEQKIENFYLNINSLDLPDIVLKRPLSNNLLFNNKQKMKSIKKPFKNEEKSLNENRKLINESSKKFKVNNFTNQSKIQSKKSLNKQDDQPKISTEESKVPRQTVHINKPKLKPFAKFANSFEDLLDKDQLKQKQIRERQIKEVEIRKKLNEQKRINYLEDKKKLIEDQSVKEKREQNKLAKYQIGDAIGKGSFAVVKQGLIKETNQKVAIKIYQKSLMMDQKKKMCLIRELQIMKQVKHKNIIKLIEIINTAKNVYIVMELFGKMTLKEYIKRDKLSYHFVKKIMKQVLSAIVYLHQNNIAHRDIKAENILYDDEQIKLIDFGFSIQTEKDKTHQSFQGTPNYMAPEIINNKFYKQHPIDIWALGVLLHRMIYTTYPFAGKTDQLLYQKIKQGYQQKERDHLYQLFQLFFTMSPDKRITAQELQDNSFFQ